LSQLKDGVHGLLGLFPKAADFLINMANYNARKTAREQAQEQRCRILGEPSEGEHTFHDDADNHPLSLVPVVLPEGYAPGLLSIDEDLTDEAIRNMFDGELTDITDSKTNTPRSASPSTYTPSTFATLSTRPMTETAHTHRRKHDWARPVSDKRRAREKERKKAQKKRRREAKGPEDYVPQKSFMKNAPLIPEQVVVNLDACNILLVSKQGFTSGRSHTKGLPDLSKMDLDSCIGMGLRYIDWNGMWVVLKVVQIIFTYCIHSTRHYLVDCEYQIVGALNGKPDDPSWDNDCRGGLG
jgi:hypothetical protein